MRADPGPVVNAASRIRRRRATKAEMEARYLALLAIVGDGPMSVRHAYYRAVTHHIVEKSENGYEKVQRAILKLRRDRRLPYEAITDATRWMRKRPSYTSLVAYLREAQHVYQRDLWADSPYRVEVWCESDSIAGVVADITDGWDVPLMPCRGMSSETFAFNAAEAWSETEREPVVLYVGDLDPAGLDIERNLRDRLAEFYGNDVRWERIGITYDQVVALDLYDLGTTPKKAFAYEAAWEAEALPAEYLRDGVETAIETYVDAERLDALRIIEEAELETLAAFADRLSA